MVHQMPSPSSKMLFISSDCDNSEVGDREILEWVNGHGYNLPSMDLIYTAYRGSTPLRSWRLAEKVKQITD